MRLKTLARAAAVTAAAAFLYRKFLRQPILTWGATAEEAAARLPGDELLEDADGVATRAITIDAPRSAVWPWIAQMGPVAARRRLHLRLDREPARPQHAQRRPRPARVPAPAGRRRLRLWHQQDELQDRRARARARNPAPRTGTGSGHSCSRSGTAARG